MKIVLDGLPPSKKNSKRVFKAGQKTIVLPSLAYGRWHNQNILRLNRLEKVGYTAVMEIIFHRKTKHRHDLDNMATSVLDLLVDAGILEDDSMDHVEALRLSWKWAPKEKTEITIF